MAEWFKALVLKTGVRATVLPWVRDRAKREDAKMLHFGARRAKVSKANRVNPTLSLPVLKNPTKQIV